MAEVFADTAASPPARPLGCLLEDGKDVWVRFNGRNGFHRQIKRGKNFRPLADVFVVTLALLFEAAEFFNGGQP